MLKVGKRLVTKLFNAGKFVLQQEAPELGREDFEEEKLFDLVSEELDRSFLCELQALVERAGAYFEEFEYAKALADTEGFFWNHFTDAYLELSKVRARSEEVTTQARKSAVATLRITLGVLLRLFAPVLPYISEEIWSWAYAGSRRLPSIHRAPWPNSKDFARLSAPESSQSFELASTALRTIYKKKSDSGVSIGRPILSLKLGLADSDGICAARVLQDIAYASRCQDLVTEVVNEQEPGTFNVLSAEFEDNKN